MQQKEWALLLSFESQAFHKSFGQDAKNSKGAQKRLNISRSTNTKYELVLEANERKSERMMQEFQDQGWYKDGDSKEQLGPSLIVFAFVSLIEG